MVSDGTAAALNYGNFQGLLYFIMYSISYLLFILYLYPVIHKPFHIKDPKTQIRPQSHIWYDFVPGSLVWYKFCFWMFYYKMFIKPVTKIVIHSVILLVGDRIRVRITYSPFCWGLSGTPSRTLLWKQLPSIHQTVKNWCSENRWSE